MNFFRFAGEITHFITILLILLKIYAKNRAPEFHSRLRSCMPLVFLTRFLDLFTDFITIYNTVMKLIFRASYLAIVWCMRVHPIVRRSYDKDLDTFRHYFLVAAIILALLVNEKFGFQKLAVAGLVQTALYADFFCY